MQRRSQTYNSVLSVLKEMNLVSHAELENSLNTLSAGDEISHLFEKATKLKDGAPQFLVHQMKLFNNSKSPSSVMLMCNRMNKTGMLPTLPMYTEALRSLASINKFERTSICDQLAISLCQDLLKRGMPLTSVLRSYMDKLIGESRSLYLALQYESLLHEAGLSDKLEFLNFRMKYLLKSGQYEIAVDTFWEALRETQDEDIDGFLRKTQYMLLVFTALSRKDFEELLRLLHLSVHNRDLVSLETLSHILTESLQQFDLPMMQYIYISHVKTGELEVEPTIQREMAILASKNHQVDLTKDILESYSDKEEADKLILFSQFGAGANLRAVWKALDDAVVRGMKLNPEELTPLVDYYGRRISLDWIKESCSTLQEAEVCHTTKELVFYSIVRAVHNYSNLTGVAFCFSSLPSVKNLLTKEVLDVVFHSIKRSNSAKISSLVLFNYLKQSYSKQEVARIMTPVNFYNMMVCQLFGKEPSWVLFLLIEYLEYYENPSPKILALCQRVIKETDDVELADFLKKHGTIESDLKEESGYKNLESSISLCMEKPSHYKSFLSQHDTMSGYGPYSLQNDDRNVTNFKMALH